MKVLTVIKASGLALLYGNIFAVASPVGTNDVGSPVTGKSAYAFGPGKVHLPTWPTKLKPHVVNDKRENSIMARQSPSIIQGLPGVLEYASQTLAVQIVGAATSLSELKHLCKHVDGLTVRLHQQGYDTNFIKNAICVAANATHLATDAEIQAQTLQASSKIWTVQALASFKGYERAFCNIFSPDAASRVGLNSTLVIDEVCFGIEKAR